MGLLAATLSASTDYKAARDAQCLADEILAAGHDLDVALPRYEAALHQYPEQVLSEVGKQIAEIPELAELGTLAR